MADNHAPRQVTFTWLQIVLERGALLSIRQTESLNRTLEGTILFPWIENCDPFEAEGKTICDVLADLNDQLCDDAAQEMIDAGAV